MPPQVVELLERRLSRLRDEHGNQLPFQDNEALETVDIRRKVTIPDAYEKFLTGTSLALSAYCEKLRSEALKLADETIRELTPEDRDSILKAVTSKVDPSLYLKRFDLFGEAIGRHFGRAGMSIKLEDYRTDLYRARQHADTSTTINRFLASLNDDLDLLIQRKQQIVSEKDVVPSDAEPHWTMHWGFWLTVVATVAGVAGTYRAFVPAAGPVVVNPMDQQALDASPPASRPRAAPLPTTPASQIPSAPK
jgi:hypothetical protein